METPDETVTTEVDKTQPDEAALGDAGKKALTAERDARKQAEKQAAELQARIDEIEVEKLSDLEKAQKAAQDAQQAAETAQREALRYKYAARHGISDEDAELFLTGDSEDVVKAQAERLAATSNQPGTPKPDLTQGGSGQPAPASNGDTFAELIESKIT